MEGDPICEEVRPGVFAIGAYSGQGNIIGTLYGKKAANWAFEEIKSIREGSEGSDSTQMSTIESTPIKGEVREQSMVHSSTKTSFFDTVLSLVPGRDV